MDEQVAEGWIVIELSFVPAQCQRHNGKIRVRCKLRKVGRGTERADALDAFIEPTFGTFKAIFARINENQLRLRQETP